MKNLRPYQTRGKDQIYKGFAVYDILMFVLATGGGKSVIAMDFIRDYILAGKRVMFIAHREQLITQFHQHLYDAKIFAGIIMAEYPLRYDLQAQVCSIQTIARRKNLPPVDLIVIDEAHHVTDKNSYNKILVQYPNAKVLMITATPYRLSGEGFKEVVKGKETGLIINSTIKTLILDGWLCPFKYYIASYIDTAGLHLRGGDYIEEEVYEKMKLVPIVDSYIKKVPGKQGIVYATNVKHSKEIAAQYNQKGIPAEHIDANTPDEDYIKDGVKYRGRQSIYSDYRCGLIKAVINVGILTEGSDFPNCDFVQWAKLSKSLSVYLQGCGRSTRTLPGLVDQYSTSQERRDAIAASEKPNAIILDNSGMVREHLFADDDHNWQMYFEGTKGRKKELQEDAENEILIYIIKDESGQKRRTTNIDELVDCELVEVTREIRQKVINIKSIKRFDELFHMFRNNPNVNKVGYLSFKEYLKFCEKNNILIVPEMWEYLYKQLVEVPDQLINKEAEKYNNNRSLYTPDLYERTIEKLKNLSISRNFLTDQRAEYELKNKSQLQAFNDKRLSMYK